MVLISLILVGGECAVATVVTTTVTTATDVPVIEQPTMDPALLLQEGSRRYAAGEFLQAATYWRQAAQRYQSQGNRLHQAISLSHRSLADQALGQWAEAGSAIAQSLQLLTALPVHHPNRAAALAQAYNTQGQLQLATGKAETALRTWQRAEQFYRQANDATGVLGSQVNQAQALQAMGLYRRAQDVLEQVYGQLAAQPEALQIAALRSLGTVWQLNGNEARSQAVLHQSLDLAQKLNQPAAISAAQFSLGNTARLFQNWDAALTFYQQAAASAPNLFLRLQAQANQLSLLVKRERQPEAMVLWQTIQLQLGELPVSRGSVAVRVNVATSLIKLNQQQWATNRSKATGQAMAKAIATELAIAVRQAQSLQDSRAEASALGRLGSLYEQTHQWQAARSVTQRALILAQSINASDLAYPLEWQLGRIRLQTGDRVGAVSAYRAAIQHLQTVRRDLTAMTPEAQFFFREEVEPVYRELVSILIDTNQPDQSVLKQVQGVIESLQLAELENFLRSSCFDAQPKPIDAIDRTAAVIYPIVLKNRLVVILAVPGQPLTHYITRIHQGQFEAMIDEALSSLNPLASDQERLQQFQTLYDWLVRPAVPFLQQHQITTLVFVPNGILQSLPMAALHDGQQYLIEKYNIALTPGLHLVELPRSPRPPQLKVLVGGLTEARQGFTALPGVAIESKQIAAELRAKVILNQDFTTAALTRQLQTTPFPIVHLATHGQFSSKLGNTFLLTWDHRLTIEQLRSLLLARTEAEGHPIELLVLSACETAEGDQRAILGLAGMAARSGARSTLATLWAVNDESTAHFMTVFYQTLMKPGMSRAAALREAQLSTLKTAQFSHPFYWAPFILVGNWL